MRIAALIATITFLGVAPAQASTKAVAQVKGAKAPVQITLQLHKTTVKVGKSLWYKLELKNIGKKKILVHDRFYKDPWVLHENCKSRLGLHLEILDPKGKLMRVQRGGGSEKHDWEPEPGGTLRLTAEETKELDDLDAEWKKRGLTQQQRSVATGRWTSELAHKKNKAEDSDPAKQLWLKPGASTTTFAWAYRDPDEDADRSLEEAQIGDYTQLWSYDFPAPGKYRIRAVYDLAGLVSYAKEIAKEYKTRMSIRAEWVQVKTPFIEFEVLP